MYCNIASLLEETFHSHEAVCIIISPNAILLGSPALLVSCCSMGRCVGVPRGNFHGILEQGTCWPVNGCKDSGACCIPHFCGSTNNTCIAVWWQGHQTWLGRWSVTKGEVRFVLILGKLSFVALPVSDYLHMWCVVGWLFVSFSSPSFFFFFIKEAHMIQPTCNWDSN